MHDVDGPDPNPYQVQQYRYYCCVVLCCAVLYRTTTVAVQGLDTILVYVMDARLLLPAKRFDNPHTSADYCCVVRDDRNQALLSSTAYKC